MAQKTDAELTTEANVIGNETTPLANTADRVRDHLINLIDSKVNNDDPGGATDWGDLGGTLSDQTDLQNALNAKEAVANKATDFSTINNTLYPSIQAVEDRIIASVAGLKWKASVRVATTVNGTFASAFENGDSVDGVTLATGNRILIKNQSTQTENGIYTVNASGAPTRSTDADAAAELESAAVSVQEGVSNANTTWLQTTDAITLGVSNIVWSAFGTSVADADETTKGIVERATDAEVLTGTDTTRFASPASIHAKLIGVQDLFIPSAAFWPRLTSGCAPLAQSEIAGALINIQTLDFDPTTEEFAQCHYKFPRKYNLGDITASFEWTCTSGSGSVVWKVSLVAIADGDSLNTAFGSAQTVTDAAASANTLRNSPDTSAITIGNSPTDADGVYIQVSRDAADGSDDCAVDAKFQGIWLHVTTDQAKDA